ncbi:MAG: flagellar hook-length control protein FliK [Treponema sp.]|nr:flagellar hook-length control protein FliK [Treponema sp.]
MIQLSPPIQSIENPEARQSASLSPGRGKTEKKDGLGVFAKLLAGLLQKTNKPGAGDAASGAEKPDKTRSGRTLETLSLAEETSGFPETGETTGSLAGPRKGKNRGTSLLRGPAEGSEKTDFLFKKEKNRAKSPSGEGAEAELAADAAVVIVRSARTRTGEASGSGALEGEVAQIQPGDPLQAGGEEGPDAAFRGGDALTLAEAADQGRSAARNGSAGLREQDQELPVGELSRYAGEDLFAGTSGSGKNARSPVRETASREGRNGGSGEVRIRDRRKERSNPEAGDTQAGLDKRDGAEGVRYQAEAGKGEEAVRDGGRETELTVELRPMGKTQAEISVDRENRPVQSFQNMLARELHENLNGDIVRHASVMLRDGGEGTIRLSLRPETLGSVKIRLEITENKIVGRIIVESDEAFKAFEQELHSLEQSFRDSGFDGASLEMAFASDGQGGRRQEEADNLFSGRFAALRYDATVSGVSEGPEETQWPGIRPDGQGRPLVNMLV